MLVSGVARPPAQKRRQPQKEIVRPRKKESTNTFDNILNTEMEKLQQDKYTYFRCMQCVEPNLQPKQKCKKCSKCGRTFDDEGICENIPAYPGMHY